MCLPAISGAQMVEVDRIMVNELKVPIELMMEHAGLSLARLAVSLASNHTREFCVIAGSGNNGGGGLVAARRLLNWNYNVKVIIPRGLPSLREVPSFQLVRLQSMGIEPEWDMPVNLPDNVAVLDAYIGYGYRKREDEITAQVFDSVRNHKLVISLDAPSGLDVTSGESDSGIQPMATLTIAFVKNGLLTASPRDVGDLYVCDIGVPSETYLNRLDIDWSYPYDSSALDQLNDAFATDSVNKVLVTRSSNYHCWTV